LTQPTNATLRALILDAQAVIEPAARRYGSLLVPPYALSASIDCTIAVMSGTQLSAVALANAIATLGDGGIVLLASDSRATRDIASSQIIAMAGPMRGSA
jgi:hypothetical protein